MERFNQDFGDCCNVFRLIKKFKLKKYFLIGYVLLKLKNIKKE